MKLWSAVVHVCSVEKNRFMIILAILKTDIQFRYMMFGDDHRCARGCQAEALAMCYDPLGIVSPKFFCYNKSFFDKILQIFCDIIIKFFTNLHHFSSTFE